MKHAGAAAIARLKPILARLRKIKDLREPRPGIFYRRSSAFIHFHEDPAGVFADIKVNDDYVRKPVNSPSEIAEFFRIVTRAIEASPPRPRRRSSSAATSD